MGEDEEQFEESQQEPQSEIDLKQAVMLAVQAVKELYEIQGYQLNDLLLEEVQRSGPDWEVTVGFTRPGSGSASVVGALSGAGPKRAFKRVTIDAETGEFEDMQIRNLPNPS